MINVGAQLKNLTVVYQVKNHEPYAVFTDEKCSGFTMALRAEAANSNSLAQKALQCGERVRKLKQEKQNA